MPSISSYLFGSPESDYSSRFVDPDQETRFDYRGRSVKVEKASDFPEIQMIMSGSANAINEAFFPVRFNKETKLMKKVINDLIFDHYAIQFRITDPLEDMMMVYKGEEYPFYQFMSKIKWDLISIEKEALDTFLSTYHSSFRKPSISHSNAYLYQDLDDAEIMAIQAYTSSSYEINRFLRGTMSRHVASHSHCVKMLLYTAVMCSGLNKITPSRKFSQSPYAYRCMKRDIPQYDLPDFITGYQDKMHSREKVKERGFTGVAYGSPQLDFLGTSDLKDCLMIYENPEKLAKDISGISVIPSENECLFLPNAKERILREIYFKKGKHSVASTRHIFLAKLISKRQRVL